MTYIVGKPPGYDRVRNAEIGNKDFELDVLEEAYTTEHWLVRIYKVKKLPNRGVWVKCCFTFLDSQYSRLRVRLSCVVAQANKQTVLFLFWIECEVYFTLF